ncbi:MAG: AhpC/TSA family protein [Planctomycetales bacterium]|nr:AhpC/TSA family protein [bacterium]UNM09549.1 MAG: AhpC/TSA family protein [Planctomycetales bacterium]
MSKQSLAQKLEELVRNSQINEQQLDILLAGFRRLSGSGLLETALREGAQAPDFRLEDTNGNFQELNAWLEHGPVLLQFFRGDWCPFCQAQLRELTAQKEQITALGTSILCVSPESPDRHRAMMEKHGIELMLLSDPGGAVANRYGIAYDLNAAESELYGELGIELTRKADSGSDFLPIPASYIVLPGGRISYSYIDPDWRKRSEPADLLGRLQALAAGGQG